MDETKALMIRSQEVVINLTYSSKSSVGQFGGESVENPPLSSNNSVDLSSDTVEIDAILQRDFFYSYFLFFILFLKYHIQV